MKLQKKQNTYYDDDDEVTYSRNLNKPKFSPYSYNSNFVSPVKSTTDGIQENLQPLMNHTNFPPLSRKNNNKIIKNDSSIWDNSTYTNNNLIDTDGFQKNNIDFQNNNNIYNSPMITPQINYNFNTRYQQKTLFDPNNVDSSNKKTKDMKLISSIKEMKLNNKKELLFDYSGIDTNDGVKPTDKPKLLNHILEVKFQNKPPNISLNNTMELRKFLKLDVDKFFKVKIRRLESGVLLLVFPNGNLSNSYKNSLLQLSAQSDGFVVNFWAP